MQATTETRKTTHAHHWLIEEAHGSTSEGHCRKCGAQRTFRNFPNEEILHRAEYVAA